VRRWRRIALPAGISGAVVAAALAASSAGAGAAGNDATTVRAECPSGLDCRVMQAAYDWSSEDHSDPNNYGNFDPADRPADGDSIRYIVIHDTEGSYDGTIADFQNPAREASSHYVIRASDGQVTQTVPTKNVAWHAGNWTLNMHSIGIEHEGVAAAAGFTEAEYRASATLVRYLAARYRIPLDRDHIIGHDEVTREVTRLGTAHWDPGPYWDWEHYFDLLGAPIRATGPANSPIVTIKPGYAHNQPVLTNCGGAACPAHGANMVHLRTAPADDAPLVTDPAVHPDGAPGTTGIDDWSDKAVAGRSYAVAQRSGAWTAIWYGGQKAWLHSSAVVPGCGQTVRARSAVPVYGRAFPEASAYPAAIPFQAAWAPTPVVYQLPVGQEYVVVGSFVGENYFARFDPAGVAGNHTLVHDHTTYLLLSFNHRLLFVKGSDLVTADSVAATG
jgi:hypothetical protein